MQRCHMLLTSAVPYRHKLGQQLDCKYPAHDGKTLSDSLVAAWLRIRYDQTIGDVKAAIAKKMNIPVDQQQLFWHKKELTEAYDSKTLLEMNMHTGFALKGYDLVSCSLHSLLSTYAINNAIARSSHAMYPRCYQIVSAKQNLRRHDDQPS